MDQQQPRGGGRAFDPTADRLAALGDVPADERPYPTRLAVALATAIVGRVLRQGERMPAAAAIADRYGCTVNDARDAVRLLVEHRMVAREAGGYAYVRGVTTMPDLTPNPEVIPVRHRARRGPTRRY